MAGNLPPADELPDCPSCGSEKVRRYAYGYILFIDEEKKREFDQEFIMGGCTVSGNSPRFHCDACSADYR